MARNEEKQQGRLNRLWLQREREEGRLKDVRETRPKLSTLNTTSSVKKWIPSIKNEIEYYLQQAQLTHYPERKIAEFQLHIEALEKEYKRFIAKLRVLDPTCKHKPWTPRAYCKKSAQQQDSISLGKKRPYAKSLDGSGDLSEGESGVTGSSGTGSHKTSATDTQGLLNQSDTGLHSQVPSSMVGINTYADSANQDLPLSFDQTRLAVAAAPLKGSSVAQGLSQTQSLVSVLRSGLPNLGAHSNNQRLTHMNNTPMVELTHGHKDPVRQETSSSSPEKRATIIGLSTEKGGHILGLDGYSSSDEEP